MTALDESEPFEIEPRTRDEYIRAIWEKVKGHDHLIRFEVIPRQDKTNGRLRILEKSMWALGGGLVVIGSLVAIIAPMVMRVLMAH